MGAYLPTIYFKYFGHKQHSKQTTSFVTIINLNASILFDTEKKLSKPQSKLLTMQTVDGFVFTIVEIKKLIVDSVSN